MDMHKYTKPSKVNAPTTVEIHIDLSPPDKFIPVSRNKSTNCTQRCSIYVDIPPRRGRQKLPQTINISIDGL